MSKLLEVKHLSVSFMTPQGEVQAVRDAGFSLHAGEVLAIVGESGCGKSVLCKSILKLLPPSAKIKSGSICLDGTDITGYREREMRRLRGSVFSMVFQDSMTVLNPSMTIGAQIEEAVKLHQPGLAKAQLRERAAELMRQSGIDRPEERMKQYPCHFSGGMRQRSVLAVALASNPRILFADEPTTALDVTMQAQILKLLADIQKKSGMAVVFVTHDLRVAARVAGRVAVMRDGKIVESGRTGEIFSDAVHPYTRTLIQALPAFSGENRMDKGIKTDKEILLATQHLSCRFPLTKKISVQAVDDVSFQIYKGEIFGLVGESGCGKSTIARCMMNIQQPDSGRIIYKGMDVTDAKAFRKNRRLLQRSRQLVFQDSASSLNPHMKVCDIVAEPMKIQHITPKRGSLRAEAAFWMRSCGLAADYLDRYPYEMSGGQRQRAAIARALSMEPELLVADEPLASLDVLTQVQILNLFRHLQKEHGFTFLLIAHDLAVVEQLCDRVGVMCRGKLVECAPAKELFAHPQHPYTKSLLAAAVLERV